MIDPPPMAPSLNEELTLTVALHSQGMQFGLSAQGDEILTILLSDPAPRQHLNSFLFTALRPLMASVGPWSNGYGMRPDNMQVTVQITQGSAGLHFSQVAQPLPAMTAAHSVLIEDITDLPDNIAPDHEPTDAGLSSDVPAGAAFTVQSDGDDTTLDTSVTSVQISTDSAEIIAHTPTCIEEISATDSSNQSAITQEQFALPAATTAFYQCLLNLILLPL